LLKTGTATLPIVYIIKQAGWFANQIRTKAGTTGTDWNGNWNGNRVLRYQKQGMFQCSNVFNKKLYGNIKRIKVRGKKNI